MAQALYNDKTNSITDICKTLRISKATLYRYVRTGDRDMTKQPYPRGGENL
jgi:hypothetical protein